MILDSKRRLLRRLDGMTIAVSHGSARAFVMARTVHLDFRVEVTAGAAC